MSSESGQLLIGCYPAGGLVLMICPTAADAAEGRRLLEANGASVKSLPLSELATIHMLPSRPIEVPPNEPGGNGHKLRP